MERQYVGIDPHRHRSVIVCRSAEGETVETVRIDNDPVALALEVAKAGADPRWCSRLRMAGTGQPTRWPSKAPTCNWPIPSATTGDIAGSRTTSATPPI